MAHCPECGGRYLGEDCPHCSAPEPPVEETPVEEEAPPEDEE